MFAETLPPAAPPPTRTGRGLLSCLVALAVGGLVALLQWAWPGAGWLLPLLAAGAVAVVVRVWPAAPPPTAPERLPLPSSDAAMRDPQTGMFHRPAFLALAERDWMRASRYGGAVALLLIEVDRLRSMTDRAGPAVADALLCGLARQVLESLRAADLLARFDDAQLAVFLPHADPTGALDVADRIRDGVQRLELPGLPEGARFGASIGVAVLRPLHQPLSTLVADAQQALRLARRAGGNCVRMAPGDALAARGSDAPWVGDGAPRPARGGDA